MIDENDKKQESEEEYKFQKLEEGQTKRPECISCGDPVKVVIHSGGLPMLAQHCRDCYAELRWGKIPRSSRRRRGL